MRRRSRVKRWIRDSYDSQWATITNQVKKLDRNVRRSSNEIFTQSMLSFI